MCCLAGFMRKSTPKSKRAWLRFVVAGLCGAGHREWFSQRVAVIGISWALISELLMENEANDGSAAVNELQSSHSSCSRRLDSLNYTITAHYSFINIHTVISDISVCVSKVCFRLFTIQPAMWRSEQQDNLSDSFSFHKQVFFLLLGYCCAPKMFCDLCLSK